MKELRRHDDEVWIERLRSQPDSTLKELYKMFKGEFQQWSGDKFGLNVEESLDVFQETMLALYQNVKTEKLSELRSTIKTYIFAIGRNQAINYLRKYGRDVQLDEEAYQNKSDHEVALSYLNRSEGLENERVDKIKTLLSKLRDPCKTIIMAFYFHRLNMEQIAEQLNYSGANVAKAQKYRCMSKFLGYITKKQ